MDIRNKFSIEQLNGDNRWYVDWRQLGPVEKNISKAKLCDIVFAHIRPYRFGVGYNVPEYNNPNGRWAVQWIDFMAWAVLEDYQIPMFARHLFDHPHLQEVNGIILETLDQAEQFVDLMEQQFTFYALKKEYA